MTPTVSRWDAALDAIRQSDELANNATKMIYDEDGEVLEKGEQTAAFFDVLLSIQAALSAQVHATLAVAEATQ